MNDKFPCKECICIAICSGKDFSVLMEDCILIHDYYYFSREENFEILREMVEYLNPP